MPTEGVALAQLRSELDCLWRGAGEPSLRDIARTARRSEHHLAYGTVRNVLKCVSRPKWNSLAWVVEALGGDESHFRQLWHAAGLENNPPPPVPEDVVDDVDELHISRLETVEEADQAQHSVGERTGAVRHEMRSLIEELASVTNKVGDLNDQLTSLNAALDQIRHQANADAAQIARLTKERDELQKDRDRLAGQIEELKERLRNASEDEIDLLKETVQIATQRAELYRGLAHSEETARRQYEQHLHRYQQHLHVASERVRALEAELASSERRIRYDLSDAEYLARTITDPDLRGEALRDTARALAKRQPAAAERLARTLTAPQLHYQALVLADTASSLIQRALPEARRLLTAAEDVAMTMTDMDKIYLRDIGLAGIAPVLAEFDLAEAGRVASVIQVSPRLAEASLGIARAAIRRGHDESARRFLADAEKASQYAHFEINQLLQEVAGVAAERDLADAERVAGLIHNDLAARAGALARIATVAATQDRGKAAELLAAAEDLMPVLDHRGRANALAGIAAAVTEWHPGKARRLLAAAEQAAAEIYYAHEQLESLQNIAVALARLDLDDSMRLAYAIAGDPRRHAVALWAVVREMAMSNLEKASEIARSIGNADYQARALTHVALARANAE